MSVKINATTSGLIETVDTSGILEIQTANGTAIIIGSDQNANFATTGAITVPVGTTAQRPTPANGMMRYNSNVSVFEVYANGSWAAANVTPAPTNTVAPVISGSAVVGQNLTSTTGTWSGSPTSYFYQWRANSSPISGQTANVISLTLTENGANITCNVTAQNIAGNSSPATSNTLGPVILGTTVNYLIVAGGGGGGGQYYSGGGGGGGYQSGTTLLVPATSYTVTIGAGGSGGVGVSVQGVNGSNTTFSAVSNASVGGGGGGAWNASPTYNGLTGGSGGGGANSGSGASGVSGQGNAGGNGGSTSGGGGGGASQTGFAGSGTTGGNGGNGTSSSISGVATYYAGGGGGSGGNNGGSDGTTGTGGLGGGGNAGTVNSSSGNPGNPGTANTGGGGGGDFAANAGGGRGGSGIVIVSYPGAQAFGGGVISTDGSNTIHTFYTSGSLVPITALNSSYLIVAGGGGGGHTIGGGGGAGGLLSGANVTIDSNSTYAITVGAGGASAVNDSSAGSRGANSSWSMVTTTAVGGGGGGSNSGPTAPTTGGSGGGAAGAGSGGTGAAGTSGQGNAGGNAPAGSPYPGGGGGGSSAVGAAGVSTQSGAGGNGTSSSISGTATFYAGGGGAGASSNFGTNPGAGGNGGGGAGAQTTTGTAGTSATGGGGGGGGSTSGGGYTGGNGGGGVVIVAYPGSTPQMAGGNVTVVSNTVVHTFTSSGYLTPFVLVNNSLRFRSSASAYLSRTYGTPTNSKIWTWSSWIKRGKLGANQEILNGNSSGSQFYFTSSDTLYFYDATSGADYGTTQVFRDPAAWYHIVVAMDTTQATAGNRTKIYVNGFQVTAFGTATAATQNNNSAFNVASTLFVLGVYNPTPNNYFDGYFSETRFVDGQALTPNSFGTFNSYGVWQPVAYAGSYGTNGFYLPFSNTANTTALCYDASPQGNNWTPNNISLTAGITYDSMKDVPTLTSANVANYCVVNPLDTGGATITNGNLTQTTPSSGYGTTRGTLAVSSGKWYWEVTPSSLTAGAQIGFCSPTEAVSSSTQLYNLATAYTYWQNGDKGSNGSSSAYGASYAANDVIGIALDLTAGTIVFYKNNTSQGTAYTGLSGTFTPAICDNSGSSSSVFNVNYGQQPFTYTPPSGFVALNTYNL